MDIPELTGVSDARGRRIVLVSHCLLNANSQVEGLATWPAIHPVVLALGASGVGIMQLPCPELLGCGMRRWGQTREQLDFPGFRALCDRLADDALASVVEFQRCGYEVLACVGIDGSPSCGVNHSASGAWGGEPEPAAWASTVSVVGSSPEPGLFMAALRTRLDAVGVRLVPAPDASNPDAVAALVADLTQR